MLGGRLTTIEPWLKMIFSFGFYSNLDKCDFWHASKDQFSINRGVNIQGLTCEKILEACVLLKNAWEEKVFELDSVKLKFV